MKNFIFASLLVTFTLAQNSVEDVSIGKYIEGTLYLSKSETSNNLIIVTAGSGMTDRNGNSTGMVNNSLKFLAEQLQTEHNVYCYDKSVFKKIKDSDFDESKLTFEDNVEDLNSIILHFKNQNKYKNIVLLGHSEGALVSLLSAKNADGLISLAGAGRSIDFILKDQLMKQVSMLENEITEGLTSLKNQLPYDNKNPMLESLFRKSVQPYIMSWMQYDPAKEIKTIDLPIVIINGTKDIQVSEEEAKLLKEANPNATLHIIENMNHILKNIEGSLSENYASYANAKLPVHDKLIEVIMEYMEKSF